MGLSMRSCAAAALCAALCSFAALPSLAVTAQESAASAESSAEAYKGWRVRDFAIQGLPGSLSSPLRDGLALSGEKKFLHRKYPWLYPATVADDVQRVRLYLAQRGYPFAQVSVHFKPDAHRERVAVTFQVKLGSAVKITRVSLTGFPDYLEPGISKSVEISPGSVFDEAAVDTTKAQLQVQLEKTGHAHAVVQAQLERLDSTKVALTFAAQPGEVYYVNGVDISGPRSDLVPLARRTVDIPAGKRYSPALIERARLNLRLLELFRRVDISTRDTAADSLEVVVALTESPHRTLEFGAGYWSDELLRAHATWTLRNLFHGGRGGQFAASYSRFLQDASTSIWWPTLLGPRTRAVLNFAVEHQNEESYTLTSENLDLSATYLPDVKSNVRAAITISNVNIHTKTVETQAIRTGEALLTIFSAGWLRDKSNERINPTLGTVTWLGVRFAPPGALSGSHFIRGEASGVNYWSLGGGVVLAARLAFGLAKPLGNSPELIANERFYSGGAQSMRGFGRHELGPLDPKGAPLGGEALYEGSTELRFPIFWRFGGAIFVDSGEVWSQIGQARFDDIEVAIGPGLLVQTPVGPGRVDWGYRLTHHIQGQPRAVLHLSVGNPY